MPTKTQSIDTFSYNMDELMSCKYVLSTKKISILLKAISQSKLLVELFQYCLTGFDYESQRTQYFISNQVGVKYFLLPRDKKTAIALIFSLLYNVDNKEHDFMGILDEFFHEKDVNQAYVRFAKEVLTPFKNLVIEVAMAMLEGEKEASVTNIVEVIPVAKPVLSDEDITEINALLEQGKGVIFQYITEAKLKTELICLCDCFRSSLYDSDIDRIKATYLGYKYGILYHRRNDSSVEKIAKILQKDGIL